MEMYYLNKYDYKTKENMCICCDTLTNIKYKQKKDAYKYILERQGDYLNVDYENFVYIGDDKPDRQRQQLCGAFYIKLSNEDPNKLNIKEYRKIYGYIYNTYEDINHIRYTVSKKIKTLIKPLYLDTTPQDEIFLKHNDIKASSYEYNKTTEPIDINYNNSN